MSVEKELENLQDAFSRVADALQKELPQIWDAAVKIWVDPQNTTKVLCQKNPFLGGKSPAELAAESPEGHEQVLTYLKRVEYGTYC